MKCQKIFLIFGILILFSLTAVQAQPPFTEQDFSEGYVLKIPQIERVNINEDFDLIIRVYNISNGVPIDNSSTNCHFFLYQKNGTDTFQGQVSYVDSNRWEIILDKGNFSNFGEMGYLAQCNSTVLGGFKNVDIFVGSELTTGKAISYLGFIIILILTLFGTLYGASQFKWKNKKDKDTGKILSINNFKYVKVLLMTLAYFELMFLFGLSYKLFNEANIDGFTQFFNFIYQLFLNLIYPLIIALIIIIFVTWINDKKFQKKIELGIN